MKSKQLSSKQGLVKQRLRPYLGRYKMFTFTYANEINKGIRMKTDTIAYKVSTSLLSFGEHSMYLGGSINVQLVSSLTGMDSVFSCLI